MKKTSLSQSAFFHPRALIGFILCLAGAFLALIGFGAFSSEIAQAASPQRPKKPTVQVVHSYHNDVSRPLRTMAVWPPKAPKDNEEREANINPKLPNHHKDKVDAVVQKGFWLSFLAPNIPSPILNFDGIPFPGVGCNCAPPDTNGAVGLTQYVQMVNEGYQVFNKTTGASVLGPNSITSLWAGFGGVCESNGHGDPVVMYDKIANRWLITQFAGTSVPTDECVAVSTGSDATGSYARYAFHLGTNFFDYPHLGVWPDAYYMSMNVFNSGGTAFLGPQAFAFDRAKMLLGQPATFVTPGITGGAAEDSFLPSDLDGSTLPPAGAPNSFVEFPSTGVYKIFHFHADFATPANTTFTLFASPPAAGFTLLCPTTRSCVPQLGTADRLDGIGDRLMFRLAYRNFGSHESVVGNFSVSAGGVAGVRWFELRDVTSGPATVFQESTYQPDSTWRWMGSVAMDGSGNLAVGYSASSASINPQIRYSGRLANEPPNVLGQGEAHLFDGTGSQSGTGSRWGDYSAMTIDPVDDHTFWYTQEYYQTTGTFNWRTRIGNFKFNTDPIVIIGGGQSIVSAGGNGIPDPGETVTVSLGVQNIGTGGCTTALTGTLQATGGVTNPAPPSHNYGAVCTGGGPSFQNYTFTVDPALPCGSPITASLVMTDGATNYGTLTYTFNTGTPNVSFTEAFDTVTAPNLPAGWVAANATGPAPLWVTSTTTPDTAPNDAFIDDPATISDKRLDTVGIAIATATTKLTFRNNFNLESTFDGGVLEVSSPNINAGAFTDITDAAVGGSFVSGGYTGVISSAFSSPIAGRMAWSGSSGGYTNTVANLGPNVAGQTIKLRFRMASDSSVAATGWRIDGLSIQDGFTCQSAGPTPLSAVSRKTHGGAGTFDVNLPLTGNVGIECRTGGATNDYSMVVTFASSVTVTGSPQAQVTSGTAVIGTGGVSNGGAVSVSGAVVTIPLTSVANAQRITVKLSGVSDGTNVGDVSISMGMLLGDTGANGTVNASDVSQTKAESGQAVGAGNFREDVNANGSISASDISLVKAQSGTALP